MKILQELYKIKEDFKGLLYYPTVDLAADPCVNYDKYWEARGRAAGPVLSDWQKKRADIVLRSLEKNSSVLDLGCGSGALIKYLEEKAGIKGVGVDSNDKILDQARSLGVSAIKTDITDLASLKALGEFDYVTGFEILEHLPCPESLLDCLRGKARRAMYFSIPNTGYWTHRLRLLLGKTPLQWASHPGEHLRFWTVSDLKRWLKSLDFKIESLELYEGIPVLNKIFPSLFSKGIVFKIAAKN